jgi:SAM-dependent methyltransferase
MDLDVPLPPVDIRQGGGRHRFDDDYYVETARSDVNFLTSVGLESDSRLLDFGCGPGRLAIGLIASGWAGSYLGVETKAVHVSWATEEITSRFPNFEFVRVDAANARYNPVGADERRLPVDDGSIDMLCAFSVFSHMLSDDTRTYLAEIRRVLHPDGRAYITAYVADEAPDETENPSWLGAWSGRLHCVVYSTDYLTRLITEAGLVVKHLGARDGRKQTGIVLGRS